ncbi:DUF499 domain-containing protein [Buchananella hordeovulneris]|uniref:DUF499 domain-containing protein n=1 Tax=Buchananella hordeovulneris TaxID=52770 RepID=UPI000F5FB436|nr:DUF499 domain-containing protein [Buchananella hordeovulneris]RRD42300.1 ATP-binding protein [Buchananella hordeovulneris]
MSLNNRDRLGRAFELLSEGLEDVVDGVLTRTYATPDWPRRWALEDARGGVIRTLSKEDVQVQLRALTEKGREFNALLSRSQQSYASELRETRNRWAHMDKFSSEETLRALDTMALLLAAVDAPDSAADVRKLHADLQRQIFADQTRQQAKRATQVKLEPGVGLKPWREALAPHPDVASGAFTAAEFAADLHQVHTGQALGAEYAQPGEFFARTYLTEGLKDLLTRAARRLGGDASASPVVNLQTNFGGGKTHSMLALYHLCSGTPVTAFPQELQELLAAAQASDIDRLPVRRAVLVGTYLEPGAVSRKPDGTEVRTLWGELAWQLGGADGYALVADADRTGTNPGQSLRTLLERYSPALILIDEWVAYARQLLTDQELPAGSFDTQFTFAQSLTEVVRQVPGAMLVVSIPASDVGSGQAGGNDIEVGGRNGQLALERLQNVIRRVADQWRPSSKGESFEIVRRRLFATPDAAAHATINATARAFANFYRQHKADFPAATSGPNDDYEARLRASYPLHPELLDRLYEDWSTLERFQRTRGVLKLVSSIVHELWRDGDTAPLILPGTVPLAATAVNTDLTQYLEDQWKPIIDSDIDSDTATAGRIDAEKVNLGQRHVTQRLARAIFLGAAPRTKATHRGLDKQYVWLGTALPGDQLGNFPTALAHLAQRSTYFYEEQGRYWFDTQPSVNKSANDYAERLREDPETVFNEIVARLSGQDRPRGAFDRVHLAPATSADVPDLEEARLVILHPRHAHRRQDKTDSAAATWVRAALEGRGAAQRVHRNSLIFLAPDHAELENLEAATRAYLAWRHILDSAEALNLSAQQRGQAERNVDGYGRTVEDRLRAAYVWALYPTQDDPTAPFALDIEKVPDSGQESLATRVSSKLERAGQLVRELGHETLGAALQDELGALWEARGEVSVGELWGFFTRYPYMLRLANRQVLDAAITGALDQLPGFSGRFAVATGRQAETGRYVGLVVPPTPHATLQVTDATLLLRWEVGEAQQQADAAAATAESAAGTDVPGEPAGDTSGLPTGAPAGASPAGSAAAAAGAGRTVWSPVAPATPAPPTTFFAVVDIDGARYARPLGEVQREVLERLAQAGADIEITLDVRARKAGGFAEAEVRTLRENARTLGFREAAFE